MRCQSMRQESVAAGASTKEFRPSTRYRRLSFSPSHSFSLSFSLITPRILSLWMCWLPTAPVGTNHHYYYHRRRRRRCQTTTFYYSSSFSSSVVPITRHPTAFLRLPPFLAGGTWLPGRRSVRPHPRSLVANPAARFLRHPRCPRPFPDTSLPPSAPPPSYTPSSLPFTHPILASPLPSPPLSLSLPLHFKSKPRR